MQIKQAISKADGKFKESLNKIWGHSGRWVSGIHAYTHTHTHKNTHTHTQTHTHTHTYIQPLFIHHKNIKANKLVGSCTIRYIKKELQLIDKNNSYKI